MRSDKIITVFGGSGFVGRMVVSRLLRRGYRVRVAVRHPERFGDLVTEGDVGQVALLSCDVKWDSDIMRAVSGAYGVINCVGILYASGRQNFFNVQALAPSRIAEISKESGVQRLVHISALGADLLSPSRYARTKAEGEEAVKREFPDAVILRPSIIFGRSDSFFNRFARMASFLPFIPLVGSGVRMQPIYVGDVAASCLVALEDFRCNGGVYELGGADIGEFEKLLDLIGRYTGRRMRYVRLPFWLAKLVGLLAGILPKPPLTRDQVLLLQRDNVVDEQALGLKDLGIEPTSVHAILPSYMDIYTQGGQYSYYRAEG